MKRNKKDRKRRRKREQEKETERERKQEYERISRTISFDEAAAGIATRIYLETLEVRPLFTVETIIVTFAMPVRARHSLDDGKLHRRRGIIKKKWRPFNALGRREERKGEKNLVPSLDTRKSSRNCLSPCENYICVCVCVCMKFFLEE